MPNYDQTGPEGRGPTGGRRGICARPESISMNRAVDLDAPPAIGARQGPGRGRCRRGGGRAQMAAGRRRGAGFASGNR